MTWFHDQQEIALLKQVVFYLKEIAQEVAPKRLNSIKLRFGGNMQGPITLNVGDKKVATVLGFDQFGAPFAIDFAANPATFTDDNEAAVADTPGSTVSDPLTAVAAGVANIGATCGGFSDSTVVTVTAPPPPVPVLSSIKLDFNDPALVPVAATAPTLHSEA